MKLLCLLLLLVAYVTVQGHWTEQSHDEALSILPEEVADPVTNVALKDSIQSALSGYDIVRGAPLNVYAGESPNFVSVVCRPEVTKFLASTISAD